MTYLERITYETGNVVANAQFVLKNAYRLKVLLEDLKGLNDYTKGSQALFIAEDKAKKAFEDARGKASEEILKAFEESPLSERDKKELRSVLLKRDYVVFSYFVENAYALGKEDVAIYESKINELQDIVSLERKLNGRLCEEADKVYPQYQ